MQLKVLGAGGAPCKPHDSISMLIDGRVLLDAGSGARRLSISEMEKVGDVLVTHSHLDHILMLCFVAESRIGSAYGHGLTVHCSPDTADAIRDGMLNGRIWPNFERIKIEGTPLMSFQYFRPFEMLDLKGVRVTPFPVEHAETPTAGFVLHGEKENFVFISDVNSISDKTCDYLNSLPDFYRMTIETSFPDGKEAIAKASGHLTPSLTEKFLGRLPADIKIYYCHIKPQYYQEISGQMKERFGEKAKRLEADMIFDI